LSKDLGKLGKDLSNLSKKSSNDSSEIIVAKDLSKIYRRGKEDIHALKNVSFAATEGEFISIIGPSGSGKTAFLNVLGCLDTPSSGSLRLNGTEVAGLKERELVGLRRDNIGFVFQQFYLMPTLTARENIELPLLFRHSPLINRYLVRNGWNGHVVVLVDEKARSDVAVRQLLHGVGILGYKILVEDKNAAGFILPDILRAAQPLCLACQDVLRSNILVRDIAFDIAAGQGRSHILRSHLDQLNAAQICIIAKRPVEQNGMSRGKIWNRYPLAF
jgi:ABC-type sugar transport system ATPase subunit